MPISTSAVEFMQRHGMRPTMKGVVPVLDVPQLRLNRIPLQPYELNPGLMYDVLGAPPPDRGKTDPWPPVQEVTG